MRRHAFLVVALFTAVTCTTYSGVMAADTTAGPFSVVVMDPLAGPLACDCVQGYAQRKYEKLGAYLQTHLHRKVNVYWSGSLSAAMEEHSIRPDLVIGKHSVVLADAKQAAVKVSPVAELSDLDGLFTQKGLFVVRTADSAKSVADLTQYRIFFGPADCDEKNAAPMATLEGHGVALPSSLEIASACSTAAAKLVELPVDVKAAAVISSYAGPLLEGCGTIRKGDLRVIGESGPVPFITAFVADSVSGEVREALTTALLDVELNAELLVALESATGFRRWSPGETSREAHQVSVDADAKKKD